MNSEGDNNRLFNNRSLDYLLFSNKIKKKKDKKYIKTNLYLNDYNFFIKNNIKMNKFREEIYKDNKKKEDKFKKENILPKILYFNKFIDNDEKKCFSNRNNNNLNLSNNNSIKSYNNCISLENSPSNKDKIEKAIIAKNLEEKSKSHVKKTIKKFEDLLKYVDSFKLVPNNLKQSKLKINLNEDNINNNNNNENEFEYDDNVIDNYSDNDDEDNFKVEKYNFDEYKKEYKKQKLNSVDRNIKISESQKEFINNISKKFENNFSKNSDDKIYLTLDYSNKNLNLNDEQKKDDNKEKAIKNLKFANMALISDDLLLNEIKNNRRNFKNSLYFDNYGKFKYTDQGLNYPHFLNKFKKIPDYQGKDVEEKKVFKYRSDVIYPKYNYTNIGSFSEKFNQDLSEISNSYGKEESKGRFLLNPLISICEKYIPNYEQYKTIKSIENKYTSRNKYKFKLKPLINNKKNNFDKLGHVIYQKEHKAIFL